jgi:hypothetical protein
VTGPEYTPPRPPGPPYAGPPQQAAGPYAGPPQQAGGPYPAAGPYPAGPQYPSGPGQPGGAYPPAPPAPPKKHAGRRVAAGIFLLVIVVVVVVVAVKARQGNPDSAVVGDCIHHGSGDNVKVVDCKDASAAYKVVGKVENKTQPQFDLSSGTICKPFPGAQSAFWKGKVGSTGYVLCLAPIK